jgi:hypothetical protein
MADVWREMHAGLAQATGGLQTAIEGLVRVVEASRHAHEEHEDLRDSVARLEKLVMEQGADLRALRARLEG